MQNEETVTGTVFLTMDGGDDDDFEGDGIVGIETDIEVIYVEAGDWDDELRDLEGELVSAKGTVSVDKRSGDLWIDVQSFDVVTLD
jgi:hypothetical protein